MTQQELTERNMGQNLDDLMNLDPRGYGICRILYQAARSNAGEPLTIHGAKLLLTAIKPDDVVFILTGFVLLPFKKAETDGVISAVMLARSLVLACGAKPVIICPKEAELAIRNLAVVAGLHVYETADELIDYPTALGLQVFSKNPAEAEAQTDSLIQAFRPQAVISIEAPGANLHGEYHTSLGKNVTHLEAKADILFNKLQKCGVVSLAIGDLGNEIGMGSIGDQIRQFVPHMADGGCDCPCGGGCLAASKADCLITATVSDWGCYGLMAALAFLKRDLHILHNRQMEKEALTVAAKSDLIDMYGWLRPAIDGIDMQMHLTIIDLMRECIRHTFKLEEKCSAWFEEVDALGFYQ